MLFLFLRAFLRVFMEEAMLIMIAITAIIGPIIIAIDIIHGPIITITIEEEIMTANIGIKNKGKAGVMKKDILTIGEKKDKDCNIKFKVKKLQFIWSFFYNFFGIYFKEK